MLGLFHKVLEFSLQITAVDMSEVSRKKDYNIINKLKLIIPQESHAKFLIFASQLEINEYLVHTRLKSGLLPIILIK